MFLIDTNVISEIRKGRRATLELPDGTQELMSRSCT